MTKLFPQFLLKSSPIYSQRKKNYEEGKKLFGEGKNFFGEQISRDSQSILPYIFKIMYARVGNLLSWKANSSGIAVLGIPDE